MGLHADGFNFQFICRRQAEIEYNELKKQVEELQMLIQQQHQNPTSEYDESIEKQQYFNETLRAQVRLCYSNHQ